MGSYTVSARKYRPDTFKSVVGQDHITNTLRNAIKNNHLAHSFLFCGPRGIGKTTCARILAKTINCENLTPEGEACNECESCKVFINNQSLNIYELDAASNNSVEDIRNLVDQVRFAPQAGKYKIYIIDEVHMLSQSAFNAFLKTLEEPPPYAIFILATTEKHRILPTILSRCQIFDFNRIQVNDIFEYLKEIAGKEGIEAEDEALHILAQKADGALRDALSLYDRIVSFSGEQITYQDVIDNLNILDYEYFFKATDHILEGNLADALLMFNEIISNGFDGANFMNGLSQHLRNLLVCKEPKTISLLELTENTQERYLEQSKKASKSFLLSGLNILNQFEQNYKASKNPRLHTELALMKLCHIQDALEIGANGQEAAPSKKKVAEQPSTESQDSSNATHPNQESGKSTSTPSNGTTQDAPTKLGSLDKIKSQVKEQQKQSPSSETTEEEEDDWDTRKKVNPESFKQVWQEYVENELKNKPALYNSLKDKPIEFEDEWTVKLVFENKSLVDTFNQEKIRINEFLEKKLDHPAIRFNTVVEKSTEEAKKRYLVNPRDIFNAMAEKNPDLKELQKRLGLQID